ncbi:MAG: 8-hydroxy-5-deazaflavin:NADPH oxidoreductase [Actinomycetota bacterium]|nr:8-hydroxy-5-deazaflavin:NADPH oxidoreductase [Actinomycetota bacterium]
MSAFIETLGLRPLGVGGLEMAHWLEGAGLLMMGLAGHGVGFKIALGVDILLTARTESQRMRRMTRVRLF